DGDYCIICDNIRKLFNQLLQRDVGRWQMSSDRIQLEPPHIIMDYTEPEEATTTNNFDQDPLLIPTMPPGTPQSQVYNTAEVSTPEQCQQCHNLQCLTCFSSLELRQFLCFVCPEGCSL
ncbi:hypothetical protein IWQ61_010534, partial [Dispira simplex]